MASEEQPENEIDQELEQLSSAAGDHIAKCRAKSCFDEFGELRDRAEREGRAIFYIHGTFFQMTQAANLLDFHTTKERAIKLISLFQKPEECFKIQPDLSQEWFDYIVHDLSSCVYENLADAAGQMEGFNSKGLHESITGGIQICRQTGKLGCIQCFREYAGDVYLAADDADLARHQCQTVVDHKGEWQSRGNRRWLAMLKLGWIELLQGNAELAQENLETALSLTDEPEVNVPIHAKFDVLCELDAVRLIRGLDPLLKQHEIFPELPTPEECPMFHLMQQQNEALEAAMSKDYAAADEILSHWDKRLWQFNALHLWFENRLRLIALRRASGQTESIDSLVRTLEEKANEAEDWLTIRRIHEVVGSDTDPCLLGVQLKDPVTSNGSHSHGVEASPPDLESLKASGEAEDEQAEVDPAEVAPVLYEQLNSMFEKIRDAGAEQAEEKSREIVGELLAITPDETLTHSDTCGVLNLMSMLISPIVDDLQDEIWKWANRIAAPFRENGVVLSLLATVGNELRLASLDPDEGRITPARLEQLFRKSIQLEKNGPQTYARAGSFFLDQDNVGEAEKCFARGFKLDRTAGNIALKLASVYNTTDRPRDALHVLDLCLREGSENDNVAWEAMLSAFHLRQFEAMLNYLNRYEEFVGEVSPINYYRGVARLELNEPELALEAIEKEMELSTTGDFHCSVIEYCARLGIEPTADCDSIAEKCVATTLQELDYIPQSDISYLFEKLWETLKANQKSQLQDRLEQKLLAAGLTPDEYFADQRDDEPLQEEMRYFRILLNQKLSDDWPTHAGCFLGQEDWTNYFCEWGVLSQDEADARSRVLDIQSKCYSGMVEVIDVQQDDQVFTDSPGIVWQGGRYSIPSDFDFSPEDLAADDFSDGLEDDENEFDGEDFDDELFGNGDFDNDD